MCGLVGFLGGNYSQSVAQELIDSMTHSLVHRGPDAQGTWFNQNEQIALGHTRLSILDLSMAGAQPMCSVSGRYVIAFNGEIYNHLNLRKELSPTISWRGHSDTETLLAGFDQWGIEETVKRAAGMFAFAIWDNQLSILTLGRDRAGEKPLYYGWQQGVFLFGSELKSLKKHPAFSSEISLDALSLYMKFSNVPAPHCIWKDIYKLMPGSLLQISLTDKIARSSYYWDPQQIFLQQKSAGFSGGQEEMLVELEQLLNQSISEKMIADVPIGAFLSGGIDSSLIVALMQRISSQKVRTYSIGFESNGFNEAGYAAEVARHLGTQHTELYLASQDALDIIPELSTIYDEPFADSSQMPTIMVSRLARKDVTVVLSGDAGDELFCGYNRYLLTHQLWQYISKFPVMMRQAAAYKLGRVPEQTWNKYAKWFSYFLPKHLRPAGMGAKLIKLFSVMTANSPPELYSQLISHWRNPHEFILNTEKMPCILPVLRETSPLHHIEEMMFCDFTHYLSNDILTKVDRASMSISLETRVPFLDHRIIEFAWSLPLEYKFFDRQTKWPLRQILYQYVPKKLIERPKMGFGIPIDDWLKGPLKEWANDLLEPSKLEQYAFLDAASVNGYWQDYLSGKAQGIGHAMWNILMFQAWLEVQ